MALEIEFGDIVSNELIEQFKATFKSEYAMSIVYNKPLTVKTYNINSKAFTDSAGIYKNYIGRVIATEELIRLLGKPPAIHYCFAAVEYSLIGRYTNQGYSAPMYKKWLKLTTDSYNSLVKVFRTEKDIRNVDLNVAVTGTEAQAKFQSLAFTTIKESTGLWRQDPEFEADIINNFIPMFKEVVDNLCGESYSTQHIIEYMNGRPADDIKKEHQEQRELPDFSESSPKLITPVTYTQIEAPAQVAQIAAPKKTVNMQSFLADNQAELGV